MQKPDRKGGCGLVQKPDRKGRCGLVQKPDRKGGCPWLRHHHASITFPL